VSTSAPRWATFDCYGTLIDWNGGTRAGLAEVFGADDAAALLRRYHEEEPLIQAGEPTLLYREVQARVLERLAEERGVDLSAGQRDLLGRSLPDWAPFPEVRGALEEARQRGWRLVILSNTDRDFIEASMERIGVPFEFAIVASEIGSYKPGHAHWRAFAERTGADPARHVHVGASVFHDVVPGTELGLTTIWINRLGESAEVRPTRELPDLAGLPEALDELVPETG
jgi:2-haloacid dehalogenase